MPTQTPRPNTVSKTNDAHVPRRNARTDADRAANPASTLVVDDREVITEPMHDPIALGAAAPLGGKIIEDYPVAKTDLVLGEPVPDPATISGAEQNRIEVLTGKRIQSTRDNPEPEVRTAKTESLAAKGPNPVV